MTTEIDTIISQLYTGAKLEIFFDTPTRRETFRKRLLAAKAAQDIYLQMILDEERQTLRFQKTEADTDCGDNFIATIWLEKKEAEKAKPIVWRIVDDSKEEKDDGNQT